MRSALRSECVGQEVCGERLDRTERWACARSCLVCSRVGPTRRCRTPGVPVTMEPQGRGRVSWRCVSGSLALFLAHTAAVLGTPVECLSSGALNPTEACVFFIFRLAHTARGRNFRCESCPASAWHFQPRA